jgi:hypothetical protein
VIKSEIKPRTEYAFREKRGAGNPLQRVRAIEPVRKSKWKVEWIEPNPGLTDYVESGQLVVSWKEHKAFLREEENEKNLREHNKRNGYEGRDTPIVLAMDQVFDSVGDEASFYRGILTAKPEPLARLRARAGITVDRGCENDGMENEQIVVGGCLSWL